MENTIKFGIVALLDALGARTADIKAAAAYIEAVGEIQEDITLSLNVTLSSLDSDSDVKDLLAALRPRFFGDSILFTYEVPDATPDLFTLFLTRIVFVLNAVVARGIDLGILFRGAIAVGEYIEEADVALGPAIVDAASWYERPEFIGVITTPATSNYLKAHFRRVIGKGYDDSEPRWGMFGYSPVPLNDGSKCPAYVLDWPSMMNVHCDEEVEGDLLLWYYERTRRLSVPVGTEQKFINTERLVRKSLVAKEAQARPETIRDAQEPEDLESFGETP